MPAAQHLAKQDALKVVVYIPVTGAKVERMQQNGITLLHGPVAEVSGHLGQFHVGVTANDAVNDLAGLAGSGQDHFDIVLDLGVTPALQPDIPPPGYFAPGQDDNALSDALMQIPELVGEFEKPKYFSYNPSICAHGSSGLTGCTRCIDNCSTLAITSAGDKIEVDPYLCQGLGSCATVCPTGAITYAYPPVRDLLESVRRLLRVYREQGGVKPVLLFHDCEAGRAQLASLAAELPECVIRFEV
jgi:ferredoxin